MRYKVNFLNEEKKECSVILDCEGMLIGALSVFHTESKSYHEDFELISVENLG